MIAFSRSFVVTTCFAIAASGSQAIAANCGNPNDTRDKWLAEWVDFIPSKGKTTSFEGKSYSQKEAIDWASKDIVDVYARRGSDLSKSPAGMSAYTVIKLGGNDRKAKKSYEKTYGDGSYADAAACWQRFQD
ncbi:hypothetical protein [Falsiphaeobacter marinintestinus]|uniref:hypothetical protein n=1 Tax=Falsiphaeobacter marinintestinus TaxID=1492905 RepID=UPI0011B7F344|nr:hypothetical protein [Phaeobacter marinintestinus]